MKENSSVFDLAASTAANLAAAVNLPLFGTDRTVKIDYVALIESLLPLDGEQQKRLIHLVCSRGLDLNLFIQLMKNGLDAELYFSAVEAGAHPALPVALFMSFIARLQPAQAQQVLTDPAAMTAAFKQLKIVESLHELLSLFTATAQDCEDMIHHENHHVSVDAVI